MLYDLTWLQEGQVFPPEIERPRIERYAQNAALFNNDHFASSVYRHRTGVNVNSVELYDKCCKRISRVVGNFDDVISFPVLLNYQRFLSLKMADLVCGEHPTITGATPEENEKIKWIQDHSNFFEKLYSGVIDISRFGDVPIRFYKGEDGYFDFCIWEADGWYPVVKQDGTYRITHHCLCWLENRNPGVTSLPDWYMHVQIHAVDEPGYYTYKVFHNGSDPRRIGKEVESKTEYTGLDECAVFNIRAFAVSGTVYGYDDYVPLDSILAEIIVRVSQISTILDKHADPAMTGPYSMLKVNPKTGETYLERGKYYAVNPDDEQPKYLTWDGQLDAAFRQLETLINQLYILSEMGAALTGGVDGSSNVVSGNAMRFKMVNPLAKARRVSNALTLPVRKIFSVIGSGLPDIEEKTGEPGSGEDTKLPFGHVAVQWVDGLPDDPREQIENCKLATGEQKLIPLEDGLMMYLDRSDAEAKDLAQRVRDQALEDQKMQLELTAAQQAQTANKPGPQDGTGVNPQRKGGKTRNFQSENNKKTEDK